MALESYTFRLKFYTFRLEFYTFRLKVYTFRLEVYFLSSIVPLFWLLANLLEAG